MAVRPILLLGDPRLWEVARPVEERELAALGDVVRDLHDTMAAFHAEHGWGRAIAAPQIGVPLRLVAMNDGRLERTFVNPALDEHSEETLEHWEDCMSFPELLVRLRNPRRCRLRYRDLDGNEHTAWLTDDYAELLQHEVDHLDGVLSVQRAVDAHAIVLRRAMPAKATALRGSYAEM